jgi:hypothetical protein
MKKNSIIIILLVIIILLLCYIFINKDNKKEIKEDNINITSKIDLGYVSILLTNKGISYLKVLDKESINKLDVNNNLKDRLINLYDNSKYYDIYLDKYKLKGYEIKLDSKITKIKKIIINDITYIIFIKENNTIGLFNYNEYYDLLYTEVIDNYNDYHNILDIEDNNIIYLDGSKEEINVK